MNLFSTTSSIKDQIRRFVIYTLSMHISIFWAWKSHIFLPRLFSFEIDFSYRQTAMRNLLALKSCSIRQFDRELHRLEFWTLCLRLHAQCSCIDNRRFSYSSQAICFYANSLQMSIEDFRDLQKIKAENEYFWLSIQNTVMITFHFFVLQMSKLDIDFLLRFSYRKKTEIILDYYKIISIEFFFSRNFLKGFYLIKKSHNLDNWLNVNLFLARLSFKWHNFI